MENHGNATTPFANPLEAMIGFHLRKTSVAVMGALAGELEPLGIRPSDATLLMVIATNPGCTQSDISRAMRAQPANLVPLVNKLVSAGFMVRQSGRGRALALDLTEQGKRLVEDVKLVFDRHEARISRSLSPEMLDQLIPALAQICKNACCQDST